MTVSSQLASEESMTQIGPLTISLVLCSLVSQAASEVKLVKITPDSNAPCTEQQCPMLTLSQFAANASDYLHSNITLLFFPGRHYLNGVNLILSNLENVVMKSEKSPTQIQCTSNFHISFNQSQYIHIANLEFIACGRNQVKSAQEFVVYNTKFTGQGESETALELIETTAQIINSTFVSNSEGRFKRCTENSILISCRGFRRLRVGGAIYSTKSTINITGSKFKDNSAFVGGAIFAEQYSSVNINENVFINNDALGEGAVLYSLSSTIFIKSSRFRNNACRNLNCNGGVLSSHSSNITIEKNNFRNNHASLGGVLSSSASTILVETSNFHFNRASFGGVFNLGTSNVTIKDSNFHNNSAIRSGGVLYCASESIITIEESAFYHNNATNGGVLYSIIERGRRMLNAVGSNVVTITESDFRYNIAFREGGVLYVLESSITIGSSNFTMNRSPIGAVISAGDGSKLLCQNYLLFDTNSADEYGVIYLVNSQLHVLYQAILYFQTIWDHW